MKKFNLFIADTLGSRGFFNINKKLTKKFGCLVTAAILQEVLSKIQYYHEIYIETGRLPDKYSIDKGVQYSFVEIADDLQVSRHTIKKYVDRLVDLQLLTYKLHGNPAKTWINFHTDFELNFKKLWVSDEKADTDNENDDINKVTNNQNNDVQNYTSSCTNLNILDVQNDTTNIIEEREKKERRKHSLSNAYATDSHNTNLIDEHDSLIDTQHSQLSTSNEDISHTTESTVSNTAIDLSNLQALNSALPEYKNFKKPHFEKLSLTGTELVIDDAYVLSLSYDDAIDYYNTYVTHLIDLEEKTSQNVNIRFTSAYSMSTHEFETRIKARKPYTDVDFTRDLMSELDDSPASFELIAKIKMKMQNLNVAYSKSLILLAKQDRDYENKKNEFFNWGGWINTYKSSLKQ